MVEMGNVWDRTAEFVSDNLTSVVPIALLTLFVPMSIISNLSDAMTDAPQLPKVLMALGTIPLALVSLWGQLVLTALALDFGSDREARAVALRRLPAAVLVAVILGIGAALIFVPCWVILYASGVPMAPDALRALPPTAMARPFAFVALYALIAMPFALWLIARLAVTTPVIVNESISLRAIARAFRLTRGVALKIVGVMILYFIVSWVAVTAAKLVFGSIFRLVAGGGGAMSLSAVLTSVIVAAIQTVFGILVATFVAKLYQALIYAHATARA